MAGPYAIAFSAAVVLALVAVPILRRVAIAADFVNRARAGRFSTRDVPYLGGIAVGLAFLSGLIVGRGDASWRLGVVALAAVGLALVGLLDDSRSLGALPRLVAQVGAACAAVAVDLRAQVTGIVAVDVAITIVWIVGITNAFNLLDNMDALAAGVACASAAGVFALAAFGGQEVVGVVAVALAGGCVGFVAYNTRPASLFLGDAGALLIGFVLAVLTLDLRPPVGQPESLLVPLLLVSVPIVDTATVVVGRLRHGRPVASGGTDHLSHRLVALGVGPGPAVAILVALQLVLAATALFLGRGVLGIGWALAIGLVLGGGLVVVGARARVYPERASGIPRRVLLAGLGALVALAVLSVPATVAGWAARGDATTGRDAVDRALDAARRGDTEVAEREFESAEAAFRSASQRLSGRLISAGLAVPVVGPNLRTTRELAAVGEELSSAGVRLAARNDPERFRIVDGVVPLEEIRAVTPDLEEAATLLDDARTRLDAVERTHLLAPVSDAMDELDERLVDAHEDAVTALAGATLAPEIFGADGPRRYFLAVQNSAELRATGGFIGNWGILVAEEGRVELDRFDRIGVLNPGPDDVRVLDPPAEFEAIAQRFDVARTWQNVNMSPDFPTVGEVIVDLFPQSGGPMVDGVVAVDSQGLAALLELTGPVDVEGWPDPITSENVVDVTLRDAYEVLDPEARVEFLGDVARTVWDEVTRRDLGSPERIGRALGSAAREGHLVVYLVNELEQRLVERVGAAGSVPPVEGDSVLVVDQNAAGNKVDYYLRRALDYQVTLTPDDDLDRAGVVGRLDVTIDNGAPASGLPEIVIGPFDERFAPGENRTLLTAYTPLAFTEATLDGERIMMEASTELGRHAYSTFVSVPAQTSRTIGLALAGTVALDDGWYVLDLLRQPMLAPDRVVVEVGVASGWRIAEAEGLTVADGVARGELDLAEPTLVRIRVEPAAASLWDRLRDG